MSALTPHTLSEIKARVSREAKGKVGEEAHSPNDALALLALCAELLDEIAEFERGPEWRDSSTFTTPEWREAANALRSKQEPPR